jgi:splicing factor 3A subunit 3
LFDAYELQRTADLDFEVAWVEGNLSISTHLTQSATKELFCYACQKQFLKENVYERHLKEKRHIKAEKVLQENPNLTLDEKQVIRASKVNELEMQFREVAYLEFLIDRYAESLRHDIIITKEKVERKQTLTESELLDELDKEEDEEPEEVEDSDDEDKIYNPLKLPLGWDGKPIPYWLYKLHGLGVEYPCEICGGYVYMGRKAFERHFQEWRHAHGMKCLGVPNSKHFQDVTKIDDAMACMYLLSVTVLLLIFVLHLIGS